MGDRPSNTALMDPAALTPSGESGPTRLKHVREQSGSVDSMTQSAKRRGAGSGAGGLNDSVDELRIGSLKLSEAQTDLRENFGSPDNPLIRPLKIHDLPDELLVGIFGYLRNCNDIKHLRLSSQRLNNTSSHLLMDTLYVSPNPKSLEHLNKVSRHGAISRGIRRVVASVDVYNAVSADSVQHFALRCIQELDNLRRNMLWKNLRTIHVSLILSFWVENIEIFNDTHIDGAHLNEAHISALHNGWRRYQQLYHEQQMVLGRGNFTQAIASAIGRMTCLEDLVIRDRPRSSDGELPRSSSTFHKLENLICNPNRLVEEMMLHILSWQTARTTGVENPPTELLYQIPPAIHDAGHSVKYLKYDLTPPHSFQLQLGSGQMSRLIHFAQGLKSFNFSARAEPAGLQRPSRDAQENEDIAFFLTCFMKSMGLISVALDFAFDERDCLAANRTQDPNRTSTGPLLTNLHQPRNIHLKNCSITLKDLRALVRLPKKEPAVLGLWYVYLLDGDWADTVELLRSEVLRGGLSQESVSRLLNSFTLSLSARHSLFTLYLTL